jgi:hypothetical protein
MRISRFILFRNVRVNTDIQNQKITFSCFQNFMSEGNRRLGLD